MGAIHFSLDKILAKQLCDALSLKVFVETGTYKGDTLACMVPYFERLYSVELAEPLWNYANQRFMNDGKVKVLHADSANFLADIAQQLNETPTLYWLDAHWCVADHVAGDKSQCPLLRELHALSPLPNCSAILIDDARLFLAPPRAPHEVSQWPAFHEILSALLNLSSAHELMVVNDVIAFFPAKARATMMSYAKINGADWLDLARRARETAPLRAALEEKEGMIQKQARALMEKEAEIERKEAALRTITASLEEKECLIHELAAALNK